MTVGDGAGPCLGPGGDGGGRRRGDGEGSGGHFRAAREQRIGGGRGPDGLLLLLLH